MKIDLVPLNREWLYALAIQPYREGVARINRAVAGVDTLSLDLTPLPWKDRAVSLMTGLSLLLPLLNTIIWFAMQTFGNPDTLADPFFLRREKGRASIEIELPQNDL